MLSDKIKIGQVFDTNCGGKVRVLKIIGTQKACIIFLRNGIQKEVNISKLLIGQVYDGNPLIKGEIYKSKNFGEFEILGGEIKENRLTYYNIRFLNTGYIKEKVEKSKILKGQVQDDSQLFGIIGKGKYSRENNYKEYQFWRNLLNRINGNSFKNYKSVELDEKWKNFQNFCEWFLNNLNGYNIDEVSLDKDILCNINHLETKIYSSETCLLIPTDINCWLGGDSIIAGVQYNEKNKHFICKFNYYINNKRVYRKFYEGDNFNEAKNFYAEYKYSQWKSFLELYTIPKKLKEILLQYDFSWSWLYENLSKEEIINKYYIK